MDAVPQVGNLVEPLTGVGAASHGGVIGRWTTGHRAPTAPTLGNPLFPPENTQETPEPGENPIPVRRQIPQTTQKRDQGQNHSWQ